jgi:hypothetical protein
MTHYLNYGIVLDSVKSFGKVQLENYDRSFTLLALVNIFKAPGNAILDGSRFDEAILICMQKKQDNFL